MFRTSTVFACTLSARIAARPTGRTRSRRRRTAGRPHPLHRGAHRRHAEARRLLPALLGRAHRQPLARDSALRHRCPLRHGSRRRTRLQRHRPRSRTGRQRQDRLLRARRTHASCWCRATRTSAPPAPIPRNAARWRTPSPSPSSGASPSPPRAMAACWWTPPISSCAMATAPATRSARGRPPTAWIARAAPSTCRAPKPSPRTPRSKSPSPSPMKPAGGRGGGGAGPTQGPPPIVVADSRCRGGRTRGGRGGRGGGLFSGTVASVTPTAEAVTLREHYSLVELPDGNYQPRYDDPRAGYGGLTFVDYSTPIGEPMVQALPAPPSPREEGSHRRHQRAGQADPVLGGSRRARGRAQSARRRRQLVEPGLRSRRIPQRLPGGRAARRRRPHGHPLQHDQLGPPLHARLEHGRHRRRSAHRRDHQGHRHARLAARPPGLPDLRRPALALHDRQREARHPLPDRARAHPPAGRARSRPHARPRPQLLRQQPGLDFRDGLSAPAGEAARRWHHRYLRGLSGAHRRLGQGRHQLRLPPASARATSPPR